MDPVEFGFNGFGVVEQSLEASSLVGLLVLKVSLGSGVGKGLVPTGVQTQDGAQPT